MDLGIDGRVAMVAAASRGIGFAAAEALVGEGARVSICSRRKDEATSAAARLGQQAIGFGCDVASVESLAKWHADTVQILGGIDILVTNTGGPAAGTLPDISDAQWQSGFESTVMNIVRLTRLVSPNMIERGWGRIVHITSLVALDPNSNLPISTTLRSGLRGLTRLQSDLLAPHGITVNSVLPGHTKTDRQKHLAEMHAAQHGGNSDDYYRSASNAIPVRRMADPSEIGDAIAFLCSERAAYITGVSLLVDGGLTRAF